LSLTIAVLTPGWDAKKRTAKVQVVVVGVRKRQVLFSTAQALAPPDVETRSTEMYSLPGLSIVTVNVCGGLTYPWGTRPKSELDGLRVAALAELAATARIATDRQLASRALREGSS
jgi:hypothetical protein